VIFWALSFSCLCVQSARETGALQAAKNKLEKQVEELTWRLQLEKRIRVGVILAMNLLRVVSSCLSEHAVRAHEFSVNLICYLSIVDFGFEAWLIF
jgi:hypothetical protein